MQNSVRDLIRAGFVKSAHDCSEGGLAVALAECCFNPEGLLGAEASLDASPSEAATVLFNESQSRIVISVAEDDAAAVLDRLKKSGMPARGWAWSAVNSFRLKWPGIGSLARRRFV